MSLHSNKISLGGGNWDSYLEKQVSKMRGEAGQVKTASANQPEVKEAESKGSNETDVAETSGQLEVEPLHQCGESDKPSEVTDENKKTDADCGEKKEEKKEEKEATSEEEVKEASTQKEALTDAQEKLPEGLKDAIKGKDGDKDEDDKEDKEDKEDDDKEEDKGEDKEDDDMKCASSTKVLKVAKLNDETKSWLREYWQTVFPADYVEAMLEDK